MSMTNIGIEQFRNMSGALRVDQGELAPSQRTLGQRIKAFFGNSQATQTIANENIIVK